MFEFAFAGHQFSALPGRALFWPARRALLVADLHLEKGSWFAAGGQMLPPFDTRATLHQLAKLADQHGAQEIWALGDNFHDSAGPERLDAAGLAALHSIATGRRLVWVTGNHDAPKTDHAQRSLSGMRAALPGEWLEDAQIDGIMLRHEADPLCALPEISGHFHPKLSVRTAARSITRPCFLHNDQRLILPSFGALTGGLDIFAPVIKQLMGPAAEAMIATDSRLLRFALADIALSPRGSRRTTTRSAQIRTS
jgi:hypothetical protein